MTECRLIDPSDVELYFYDELEGPDRRRAADHIAACPVCRQRLEDLRAIREALGSRPAVNAPPAGDWSGFMRRLDEAVGVSAPRAAATEPAVVRVPFSLRQAAALAAMLALVTTGVFMAARVRGPQPASPAAGVSQAAASGTADTSAEAKEQDRALREVSAEHLERSKLVVLGLATRDPRRTSSADWKYERDLAGTLLPDTRLYRLEAQQRGVTDVARVMRDLETVLLEASMSDNTDRDALGRVQRLIDRRDLVAKMQMVSSSNAAGL